MLRFSLPLIPKVIAIHKEFLYGVNNFLVRLDRYSVFSCADIESFVAYTTSCTQSRVRYYPMIKELNVILF